MTDPKTVTVQERLRAYAVPWRAHGWADEADAINEAADLLDRCKEALEHILAGTLSLPRFCEDEAREVLTQLNGGRNVG